MPQFKNIRPGDPAPWFKQRTPVRESYTFDTAAGRNIALCFFARLAEPRAQAALKAALVATHVFDDVQASFFGVSNEPADEGKLAERYPGYRYFYDFDRRVARLYGVQAEDDANLLRPQWVILDPMLRVLRVAPLTDDPADIIAYVAALPKAGSASFQARPPVLQLDNVFEPELCAALIAHYEARGGETSGYMQERDGKTVLVVDPQHKVRSDVILEDPTLIAQVQNRVRRRIAPEIAKAYQFDATRMERYLIGCYEPGGHFRPHRDNTTKGTAHRRFAVSINLNDVFDGGELSFPEFGPTSFKPPPGAAVVFSCSLLHAVSPVREGRRYAFLPFLYDEVAAEVRERNSGFLDSSYAPYKKDPA